MGGPAGMADAQGTVERLGLEQSGEALIDLAFAFAELELIVREGADAGAVIAAILEAAQTFKDDRTGWLFADVTYDAAHGRVVVGWWMVDGWGGECRNGECRAIWGAPFGRRTAWRHGSTGNSLRGRIGMGAGGAGSVPAERCAVRTRAAGWCRSLWERRLEATGSIGFSLVPVRFSARNHTE